MIISTAGRYLEIRGHTAAREVRHSASRKLKISDMPGEIRYRLSGPGIELQRLFLVCHRVICPNRCTGPVLTYGASTALWCRVKWV